MSLQKLDPSLFIYSSQNRLNKLIISKKIYGANINLADFDTQSRFDNTINIINGYIVIFETSI